MDSLINAVAHGQTPKTNPEELNERDIGSERRRVHLLKNSYPTKVHREHLEGL